MRENKFIYEDGQVVLKRDALPAVGEKLGKKRALSEKRRCHDSVPELYWSNDVADGSHRPTLLLAWHSGLSHGETPKRSQEPLSLLVEILVDNQDHAMCTPLPRLLRNFRG